jgi:tRNA nucleotidyltransferase (CCA-adding enzyme)
MNEDVDRVLRAIRAAGGHPLLVGGCVRDYIMGLNPKDIDVEVYNLQPDDLFDVLKRVGAVKEAGRSFGVFKVHTGDTDLDISLPRRESKSGQGHRGFDVIADTTMGQEEASARRDLTINAMMLDTETGTLYDFHGGLEDLQAGVLRHTSEAFSEDPLRVLRLVQFVSRFGFKIHPTTIDLCTDLKGEFETLSVERIWGEFEKIGRKGKYISRAIDALFDMDWIGCFPELCLVSGHEADQVAANVDAIGMGAREDRLVVVFAALFLQAGPELAQSFLESIGCPQAIISRVIPLVRECNAFDSEPTPSGVRRLARRLVPSSIADLYAIDPKIAWLAMAHEQDVTTAPQKPILTGNDLIEMGLTPGPSFKAILAAALEAQDFGEFTTKPGAIAWMESR